MHENWGKAVATVGVLAAFGLCLRYVYLDFGGFWCGAGVLIAPVTAVFGPWYVALKHGTLLPMLLMYGSPVLAWAIVAVADRPNSRSRSAVMSTEGSITKRIGAILLGLIVFALAVNSFVRVSAGGGESHGIIEEWLFRSPSPSSAAAE